MIFKLQSDSYGNDNTAAPRSTANKLRARTFVDHWQTNILLKYQHCAHTSFTFCQFDFFKWYANRQVLLDACWAIRSMTFFLVFMALFT